MKALYKVTIKEDNKYTNGAILSWIPTSIFLKLL